jgi:biotin transport system permease protein
MLTYRPGRSLLHRLDPRTKLLLQLGFAIAVFSVAGPWLLAALAVLPLAAIVLVRLSPLAIVRAFWPLLVFLAFGPLFAMVQFGPPWIDPAAAIESLLAVARVVLVVGLSAAYIRSTPARDSRAAVQRTIPGKPGQLLGVGVGLTIRYLPVLRRDVATLWDAIRARGGQRRSIVDTGRLLIEGGLRRAIRRSDRLSLALQARCFAWNPKLPALSFSWLDVPVLVLGAVLALSPLRGLL